MKTKTAKATVPKTDKMVRVSGFTYNQLQEALPDVTEYWHRLDKASGRELSKISMNDVIRTLILAGREQICNILKKEGSGK